jgi:hypothetical protein
MTVQFLIVMVALGALWGIWRERRSERKQQARLDQAADVAYVDEVARMRARKAAEPLTLEDELDRITRR